MYTRQRKNIFFHSHVYASGHRAQDTKVTLTRLALAIPASPFSNLPSECAPTHTFTSGRIALHCSALLKSERTHRMILGWRQHPGLTHHSSSTLDESFHYSKQVLAIKMKAVHQWFSEYCPYQHRLQTWHILRILSSPTELEESGMEPNKFV